MGDKLSFGIRGKIAYIGHPRYLPYNHVWRRSKLYDGSVECRSTQVVPNGHDILEQLNFLKFLVMSKHPSLNDKKKKKKKEKALNSTKKSIFFKLPN